MDKVENFFDVNIIIKPNKKNQKFLFTIFFLKLGTLVGILDRLIIFWFIFIIYWLISLNWRWLFFHNKFRLCEMWLLLFECIEMDGMYNISNLFLILCISSWIFCQNFWFRWWINCTEVIKDYFYSLDIDSFFHGVNSKI